MLSPVSMIWFRRVLVQGFSEVVSVLEKECVPVLQVQRTRGTGPRRLRSPLRVRGSSGVGVVTRMDDLPCGTPMSHSCQKVKSTNEAFVSNPSTNPDRKTKSANFKLEIYFDRPAENECLSTYSTDLCNSEKRPQTERGTRWCCRPYR